MLTSIKNNRSLTFYQTTPTTYSRQMTSSSTGGIAASSFASVAYGTTSTTNGFNDQLNAFLRDLNQKRASDISRLDLSKPNSTARNRGVSRAWEYEQADIEMGGKGSANWDESQRAEIRETGRVRGAEGHHQQNVSDHPEGQADPDNIKFYKDRQEHLEKGHQGNWQNESDAETIDKNRMLKRTNSRRVIKNELTGLGLAVAIGFGIGLTIGFATALAQSGLSPDALKNAAIQGAKSGLESGVLSAVSYGIGRTIGEVATKAIAGVFENVGVTLTENLTKMINMGVVGVLTIGIFSVYQFVKLKLNGVGTKEALIQTGKQALFSLSLLAVSIAAQGIWGGPAGIIVSVSVGIILISYSVIDTTHKRRFAEKVRVYTIEKCYPTSLLEV